MKDYKDILAELISKEWTMFTNTKSIGSGRAACQDDMPTFINARKAQWSAYPVEIVASYLDDINQAIKDGRNLVTDKYAYMMEDTNYNDYLAIKHLIPELDSEKLLLVNDILAMMLRAEEKIRMENPSILDGSRPLYSKDNTSTQTSIETYLRGELKTYSVHTLSLIKDFIQKRDDDVLKTQLNTLTNKKKKTDTNPRKNISSLNLKVANRMIDLGIEYAESQGKSFVISICDASGAIIALKKMDSALVASVAISQAKAITAAHYKMDTLSLQNSDSLLKPLEQWNKDFPHGYCFMGGGIPIYKDEKIIGAVGVSGGSIDEDINIAKHILSLI